MLQIYIQIEHDDGITPPMLRKLTATICFGKTKEKQQQKEKEIAISFGYSRI